MQFIRYGFMLLGACITAAISLSQPVAQQMTTKKHDSPEQPQSKWATQCSSTARSQPLGCSMEQRIILSETGQQLARVSIQVGVEEPRQPAILIHLPLGLSMRSGISLKVDDGEPLKLDVQTCEVAGCYAGNPISSDLLASLKEGKALKVQFENMQQRKISVQFSLLGFTKAYSDIE